MYSCEHSRAFFALLSLGFATHTHMVPPPRRLGTVACTSGQFFRIFFFAARSSSFLMELLCLLCRVWHFREECDRVCVFVRWSFIHNGSRTAPLLLPSVCLVRGPSKEPVPVLVSITVFLSPFLGFLFHTLPIDTLTHSRGFPLMSSRRRRRRSVCPPVVTLLLDGFSGSSCRFSLLPLLLLGLSLLSRAAHRVHMHAHAFWRPTSRGAPPHRRS